jgi:hypothetical protein
VRWDGSGFVNARSGAAVRRLIIRTVTRIVLTLSMAAIALGGCSMSPNVVSVGFGTGGSECELTGGASSFTIGVPIRYALTISPALPAGGSVEIRVEKDGIELVELHDTVTVEEPAPCIYSTLADWEIGEYRFEYSIEPSALPPIVGEFEVTP